MATKARKSYSDVEREVFSIKACVDMIDDMVNYAMFDINFQNDNAHILPKSDAHKRLLCILLTDLLSGPQNSDLLEKPPRDRPPAYQTFLHYLDTIGSAPRLGKDGSGLSTTVHNLAAWLDAPCNARGIHMPNLGITADLVCSRMDFIKVCGNLCKHSFPRLSANARKIQSILSANGHDVPTEMAYMAMEDFHNNFYDDIFGYHLSAIAESLNKIRWSIYRYLHEEFRRSYEEHSGDPIEYRFKKPAGCLSNIGIRSHWDLMNWVRTGPMMPEFAIPEVMKIRY